MRVLGWMLAFDKKVIQQIKIALRENTYNAGCGGHIGIEKLLEASSKTVIIDSGENTLDVITKQKLNGRKRAQRAPKLCYNI